MEDVYLDIETTGLDPNEDEILEVAIVEENGKILLNTLIKPCHHGQWDQAEKINGISPAMVKDVPKKAQVDSLIAKAIKGRNIYIWNAKFDTAFLPYLQKHAKKVICAMEEFGDYIEKTQPQNKSKSGRYKMENTARDLNIEIQNQHRALGDVRAMIAIRKTYLRPGFKRTNLSGSKHVEAYRELA